MQKSNLESAFKSRLKGLLEEALVYDKTLETAHFEQKDLETKIKEVKSEKGDEGFQEVREQLSTFREKFTNIHLYATDYHNIMGTLKELYDVSRLADFDLELEDETKKFLEDVSKTYQRQFITEDGKLKFADNKVGEIIQSKLSEQTDKELKEMYNSPMF